jgi:hypothetical protein
MIDRGIGGRRRSCCRVKLKRAGCIGAAICASDLWPHRNPTRADRSRFAVADCQWPFSFRCAVPIFAACAILWSVIRQSRVRSAAGGRSSDFGHFVLAGALISTSAVGSLAATRLRPTRGASLSSPRTTDRSVVVDSRMKKSASPKEHRPGCAFRPVTLGQDARKSALGEWHRRSKPRPRG